MYTIILGCAEFSYLEEITPEKKPLQSRTKKLNPIFMIGLSDEEELISSPENHKTLQDAGVLGDGQNSEKKPQVQRLRKTIQSSTGSQSTNVEKIFEDSSKASISIIKCKPPIPNTHKLNGLTSVEESFTERKDAVKPAVKPSKALDILNSLNCSKSGKSLRLLDSLSSNDTLKPLKSLRTLNSFKLEEPLDLAEKNFKKLPDATKEEEPSRIVCADKERVVRQSPSPERSTPSNKAVPIVTTSPPEEGSAVGDEESGGSITKSGYCVKFEPGLNEYLSELAQSHHFQTSINEVNEL